MGAEAVSTPMRHFIEPAHRKGLGVSAAERWAGVLFGQAVWRPRGLFEGMLPNQGGRKGGVQAVRKEDEYDRSRSSCIFSHLLVRYGFNTQGVWSQ